MLNYEMPDTVERAVSALNASEAATIVAGGTLAMPGITSGRTDSVTAIDLSKLAIDSIVTNGVSPHSPLASNQSADGLVELGACVRISQVVAHDEPAVRLLRAAGQSIGGPALRNLASVGGNIFHGGDLSAALLALGAVLLISGAEGAESASEFGLDRFYDQGMASSPGLLTHVRYATSDVQSFGFRKFSRRAFNAPSIVSAAVCQRSSGAVIGLIGAGPHPLAIHTDDDVLQYSSKQLEDLVEQHCVAPPLSDAHATSNYRRQMIPRVIADAVSDARAQTLGLG